MNTATNMNVRITRPPNEPPTMAPIGDGLEVLKLAARVGDKVEEEGPGGDEGVDTGASRVVVTRK
jgi:Na+-transporting NADH:ubiquinone oxidoreductase subunit NqrF